MTDKVLWDGEVVPGFVNHPKGRSERKAIAETTSGARPPRLMTSTFRCATGVSI